MPSEKGGFVKSLIFVFIVAVGFRTQASIEVLFHPHDPTLEKIAALISEAQHSVDIAMYNMDTTNRSPVIVALGSEPVQARIKTQSLKIRLIFEGYGTEAENQKKMSELEALGVDVRFLGRSVKMHHKFAVIDATRDGKSVNPEAQVITGSANWSLSSYRNYNENILFIKGEPESTTRFYLEFVRLWNASKEFGSQDPTPLTSLTAINEAEIEIYFNSPRRLEPASREPSNLTAQIVRLIDGARFSIDVASTRIRLVPILESVLRAADRGVLVKLLISQDDFRDIQLRSKWLLGHKNIEVRVKFYSLRPADYLFFQMHNKFMLVDDEAVLTGSFNWSSSSENNHFENLVELRGAKAQDSLTQFKSEFQNLWAMNRDQLETLKQSFAKASEGGKIPKCSFKPTVFTIDEITALLAEFPKCG
jgi:phosphatidylserine/phosphatidylglycerophosphate/cardiolipin synthase-like enzyme